MTWQVHPGIIVAPILHAKFPLAFQLEYPLLIGRGNDSGYYCYRPDYGIGSLDVYTISWLVGHTYSINSTECLRMGGYVHGYPWYVITGWQLYYTPTWGWVIINRNRPPGYIPVEHYDSDSGTYSGDAFWGGSVPSIDGSPTSFQPRGSIRSSGTAREVGFIFPRWQKADDKPDSPYGVYDPVQDWLPSGQLEVGNPVWKDQYGTLYMRSLNRINSRYTYGNARYVTAAAGWVIGTYGSDDGWWQGAEPSIGAPVTYTYALPEGVENPDPPGNLTLTYQGHVAGDAYTHVWLAELGILREGDAV